MLGCVYVVTTDCYKSKSIFKIGFTTNLTKRLKTFNATRMTDDLFYCVRQWRTVHYSKLEAFLHQHLKEFRRKNEFFEVDLQTIEKGAELFAMTHGPQFFYEDVVLINAEIFEVEYAEPIFTVKNHHTDDIGMRDVITEWLSCVDVYNLLKFAASDVLDRLVMLLKQACAVETPDLSADFRRMAL